MRNLFAKKRLRTPGNYHKPPIVSVEAASGEGQQLVAIGGVNISAIDIVPGQAVHVLVKHCLVGQAGVLVVRKSSFFMS